MSADVGDSFMKDGLENDDKYRMVEDEFLTVAQQFTVHLHAAEYKRQQAQVKARNADAIRSISRPVTTKMPDQTKRKVEANERSIAQRNALKGLRRKDSIDTEQSDSEDLPYIGTTLHSFMDSPHKKAVSLLRSGSISTATRAAAGFTKQSTQTKSPMRPPSSIKGRTAENAPEQIEESETESEEDEDLDVPIPPPKLGLSKSKKSSTGDSLSESKSVPNIPKPTAIVTRIQSREFGDAKLEIPTERLQSDHGMISDNPRKAHPLGKTPPTNDFSIGNDPPLSKTTHRQLSRIGYARKQKAKQETKDEKEKELDVIPSFL
jgi:hypothetical protein